MEGKKKEWLKKKTRHSQVLTLEQTQIFLPTNNYSQLLVVVAIYGIFRLSLFVVGVTSSGCQTRERRTTGSPP